MIMQKSPLCKTSLEVCYYRAKDGTWNNSRLSGRWGQHVWYTRWITMQTEGLKRKGILVRMDEKAWRSADDRDDKQKKMIGFNVGENRIDRWATVGGNDEMYRVCVKSWRTRKQRGRWVVDWIHGHSELNRESVEGERGDVCSGASERIGQIWLIEDLSR